jgi:hypothetical protein
MILRSIACLTIEEELEIGTTSKWSLASQEEHSLTWVRAKLNSNVKILRVGIFFLINHRTC